MLSPRGMPRACPAAATYQRRQPEQTVLYRTIAAHLPTFGQVVRGVVVFPAARRA